MRSQLYRLRNLGLVAASALMAVTLSAYAWAGQDQDPYAEKQAPSKKADKVSVVLKDYGIEMPKKLQAGETTFEITNKGSMAHSLVIENTEMEKKLESSVPAGESATFTVALGPGEYDVYCPEGDHAKRGGSVHVSVTSPTK